MKVSTLAYDEIIYTRTDYDESLRASVARMGFAFPLKVKKEDGQVVCVDGHKRLSALGDILKDDPDFKHRHKIPVIFTDGEDVRTNDAWRGRNVH